MAQLHYEAYHAPRPQPHTQQGVPQGGAGVGRLVNFAGAVMSVALLFGVGVWSYKLMVRDVSGIPVIRALEGPFRESPEDPQGRRTAHQGLAVNTVAAEGGVAGAAQVIALAPPPIELTDADRVPMQQLAAAQPIQTPPPATLAPIAQPAPVVAAPTVNLDAPVQVAATALVPASAPGVSRSPVPRARPGRAPVQMAAAPQAGASGHDAQAEAVLQELVTRLSSNRVTEIDPSTLAAGTRLVQLGAYDSDFEAREAWDSLMTRFPGLLDGRARIVEPASAGGRTFFRLRAHGFVDEPEARRFCSVFLADNVDCIPVLIR